MGAHTFDIKNFQPLVGVPVVIRTNWKSYLATLSRSVFGGFEFRVVGEEHAVQLTTVRAWHFANAHD